MATINNIKKRAKEITEAFEPESVTSEKVGKLFEDIADVTEQAVIANESVMEETVAAAEQAAQAAEDASGYLADLQEAIADLPDGQAVSAEVADHELRVSDLEANSATKEEVANKYGDYEEISEFLEVKTDADDNILEGIKSDGTKVFSGNVEAPNINQMMEDVDDVKGRTDSVEEAIEAQGAINDANTITDEEGNIVDTPMSVIDNPEFLDVHTDADGNILYGIREDGTFTAPKSSFVDKEKDKSLIDEEYANSIERIDNNEFLEVHLDADGNIMYGVRKDGTFFCHGASEEVAKALAEFMEYVNDRLERKIPQLKTSAFLNDFMLQPTDIQIPDVGNDTATLIEVSNASEFNLALTTYIGGTNVIISLTDDIILDETALISEVQGSPNLTINGNGHRLIVADADYTASQYNGSEARAEYEGSVEDCAYVSDSFDLLRLRRSAFFEVDGAITDENGNIVSTGTIFNEASGIRKFKLPADFDGITFDASQSGETVFINFSTAWQSQTSQVTKIVEENGGTYLYFDYQGGYAANFERNSSQDRVNSSFFLINFSQLPDFNIGEGKPISIKNGYINFSAQYRSVKKCKSEVVSIVSNSGLVVIDNLAIVGGSNAIKSDQSEVIVKNCNFLGCSSHAILAVQQAVSNGVIVSNSKIYCINNRFSTLQQSAINGSYGSVVYAVGNRSKDTSLCRKNYKAIAAQGHFYIADNIIEDYGYSATGGGTTYLHNQGVVNSAYGIIENNIIRQTEEFVKYSEHRCLSDGGVIYNPTHNNPYVIIRFNKITNCYRRRGAAGIYLDDGAYNTYMIGNIVENCPSYAIYNRYAVPQAEPDSQPLPSGINPNTNKVCLHNICDQAILIQGTPYIADNGCYVGYNLITGACTMDNDIKNVKGEEEQIFSQIASICQGVVKGVKDSQGRATTHEWTNK